MAELSISALRLFAYLPPTYGADPDDLDPLVARWLEAIAFELDLARALLEAIRRAAVPSIADDSVGGLSRWEAVFRLPVAPADLSVDQRRARVVAALRGRVVASGRQWKDAMDAALAGVVWTVERNAPTPEHLRITIPHAPGSPTAAQVEAFARRRSPATQVLVMAYDAGFIVGESRVGDAL